MCGIGNFELLIEHRHCDRHSFSEDAGLFRVFQMSGPRAARVFKELPGVVVIVVSTGDGMLLVVP